MQGSVPHAYTISDFIEWNRRKQLKLDPSFQRGAVWKSSAQAFLIDTILNNYPIPQIYLRTKFDPIQQGSIREVVDGQQRLRAILDFSEGKLKTPRNSRFNGSNYEGLEVELKNSFLSYQISTVQLLDATDADVLEVFARLNSYSVKVTPAELRHAQYDEPVKWAIWEASRNWAILWENYRIVSVREAIRLKNTSVMAELFMMCQLGLVDGGEAAITKYYKDNKNQTEDYFKKISDIVNYTLDDIITKLSEQLKSTTFFDSPNFILLFYAVGFLRGDVNSAGAPEELLPLYGNGIDYGRGGEQLLQVQQAIESDDENGPYGRFISANRGTTHRRSTRTVRLNTIVRALSDNEAF